VPNIPIRPGQFAVRFTYNSVNLDFDEPATAVRPETLPIGVSNAAQSGDEEYLHFRFETTLTLGWLTLSTAKMAELQQWYTTWGALKKQTVIILDRLGTCAGQREYDVFNSFFTRAVLITAPGQLQLPVAGDNVRLFLGRSIYRATLNFRQAPA
jgi:hypothetical protein